MKQLKYNGVNNFTLKETLMPAVKENEVLVKVKSIGLCGSDIHKFLHQEPTKGYLKTDVLGHEVFGTIEALGKNVNNFKVGESVVLNPFSCPYACKDHCPGYGLCNKTKILGRNVDGGYSEYVVIDKNSAYSAKSINFKQGVFVDDLAVAYHGIHLLENKKATKVAIIGDGPLGILVYRTYSYLNKNCDVVLFSKNPDKLKNLKDIKYINYKEIQNHSNQYDIVFEVVGGNQSSTLENAINVTKPSGKIGIFGVFPFGFMPEVNIRNAFYKELTIKGINSYCKKHNDFEIALKLIKQGKIKVDDLVTHIESFYNIEKFLKEYHTKEKVIKAVFTID